MRLNNQSEITLMKTGVCGRIYIYTYARKYNSLLVKDLLALRDIGSLYFRGLYAIAAGTILYKASTSFAGTIVYIYCNI